MLMSHSISDLGGRQLRMLTVNKRYAENYEQSKRKADLANNAGTLATDRDEGFNSYASTSSSSEDEDGECLTKGLDRQINQTLALLSAKDPSIYKNDTVLYPSDEDIEDGNSSDERDDRQSAAAPTGKRTITILAREKIMAKLDDDSIPGDISDSDSESESIKVRQQEAMPTYAQEQVALQSEIRASLQTNEHHTESDTESDNFFTVRRKTQEEETVRQQEIEAAFVNGLSRAENSTAARQRTANAVLDRGRARSIAETHGDQSKLTGDAFLHDYIVNQGWLDANSRQRSRQPSPTTADLEDDLDAVNAAEKFEHNYNFRFEEGNAEITGHARNIPDTARRADERRKRKRAEKAARKAALRQEATNELKRLKNLKRAELEAKLKAVHDIAGIAATGNRVNTESTTFSTDDIDDDFDPATWDAKMSAVFNSDFYSDDAAAAADEHKFGDSTSATYDALSDHWTNTGQGGKSTTVSMPNEAKRRKIKNQSVVDTSELHAMDFEGIIGSNRNDAIKTRFKYATVQPESYGLAPVDILLMDDKELNKRASLKKLAPYRRENPRNSKYRNKSG